MFQKNLAVILIGIILKLQINTEESDTFTYFEISNQWKQCLFTYWALITLHTIIFSMQIIYMSCKIYT